MAGPFDLFWTVLKFETLLYYSLSSSFPRPGFQLVCLSFFLPCRQWLFQLTSLPLSLRPTTVVVVVITFLVLKDSLAGQVVKRLGTRGSVDVRSFITATFRRRPSRLSPCIGWRQPPTFRLLNAAHFSVLACLF